MRGLLVFLMACHHRETPVPDRIEAPVETTTAPVHARPEPPPFARVAGAIVAPPRESRAIAVVALHGGGDRADGTCDAWRFITDGDALVVCPEVQSIYDAASESALRARIDATLAEAGTRWNIDVSRPLLAGFSTGAWYAGRLAAKSPDRFARVVLLESLGLPMSGARGLGGMQVLLACGSETCSAAARIASGELARAGADVRVENTTIGHSYGRPLQLRVRDQMGWLALR
jgi:predicted esterase